MDFSELVKVRQSVRSYTPEPVQEAELTACLEAARLSPSACNSQPWKFIVVNEAEKLAEVAGALYDPAIGINKFATTAPVLVAVVVEEGKLMPGAKVPWDYWADFDNGSAVAYFCLQAAELGLGTCIMGSYDEEKVKKALAVPDERKVRMIIALGHSESDVIRTKARKPMEAFASFNGY